MNKLSSKKKVSKKTNVSNDKQLSRIITLTLAGIFLSIMCTANVHSQSSAFPENTAFKKLENDQHSEKQKPIDKHLEKEISVDFRDTPIQDVMRGIAAQADVDIITTPSLEGTVTAKLTDVPLGEALDNILAAHGYAYIATDNMIRVGLPAELYTPHEKIMTKVYRIIYADVEEVEGALKKFLSPSIGSISSSPGTSNLLISDTESKIKAIDEFIEEIDRITPQVLVEVRIYDVTTTEGLDLSTAWNIGTNNMDNGASSADRTGANMGIPTTQAADRTNSLFAAGSFDDTNGGAIRIGLLNNAIDIDIMFKMLQKQIGAKLLANPRIMVLDNEQANFKIVREIPYTEQTQTSQGGQLTSTSFKEVGVDLLVTPHITRDGMIRLQIAPEFGVVVEQNDNGAPTVDTRKVRTLALVKDKQTVVLGGLRKRETTKTIKKAPVLGDLPLVGGLFRDELDEVVTNELIIFITPRIVIEPKMSPSEISVFARTDLPPAKDDETLKVDERYDREKNRLQTK